MPRTRTRANLAAIAAALPYRHPLAVAARNVARAMALDAKRKRGPAGTKATALWRASLALAALAGTPTKGSTGGP